MATVVKYNPCSDPDLYVGIPTETVWDMFNMINKDVEARPVFCREMTFLPERSVALRARRSAEVVRISGKDVSAQSLIQAEVDEIFAAYSAKRYPEALRACIRVITTVWRIFAVVRKARDVDADTLVVGESLIR